MKKNLLIFGDSYSTFQGYIPDGYATYYSKFSGVGNDVLRVEDTWWYGVAQEAGFNIVLNNSWSGSTIGYTGYNNSDCSKTSSFIYRLKQLFENGFFSENEIDTVFVFGGTNDSWSNAPLGEIKYDCTENDLYCVLPAICRFLKLLKDILPKAQIYCLINTGLKSEIAYCLKQASEKYGIIPVAFENIHKTDGHPTVRGMNDIKEKVLASLQ